MRFYCIILGCYLLLIAPVSAEQVERYEDLVVTASLTPVAKTSVGSSVTVITAAEINQKGYHQLADILRAVPGLAVSRSGSFGALTDVRIRGAEANHTLILIDGIKANDPGNFTSGFDLGALTTANIERIEVLRGPQSALWGSDSIGGVINIITQQGRGPAQVTASFEGGSFATQNTQLAASYGDDSFHINLSAGILSTDGINIARIGSEEDSYHNRSYDLKLGFQPLDTIALNYNYKIINTDIDTDPQPFPSPVVVDGRRNQEESRQYYQKGSATIALFDERWIQHVNIERISTQLNSQAAIFGASVSRGERHKYAYQNDIHMSGRLWDSEHYLSLLLEYQDDKATGSFIGNGTEVGFVTKSYVAEYRLELLKKLFLSVSGRHDNNDFFADANTYRVSAAYLFTATDTRLRLAYGTGIKNPTITELFGNFTRFIGNPSLSPETSSSWDIGLEQYFFNQRLAVDMGYFNNRITDQITGFVNTFSTPVVSTVENSKGTNHSYGIETTVSAALSEQLQLTAQYTFTRADNANDNALIRRPKHIGSVNINYTWLNDNANINLNILYNGQQQDLIFATTSSETTLGAYTIVNLSGQYKLNKLMTLQGRIENLFDERYEEVYSYRSTGIAAYAGIHLTLDI